MYIHFYKRKWLVSDDTACKVWKESSVILPDVQKWIIDKFK